MSYIDYINRFWKHARTASLNSNDIAVFFYLLDAFNRSRWSSAIKLNSAEIIEYFGMHRHTIREILNKIDMFTDIHVERQNGSKWVFLYLKPCMQAEKLTDKQKKAVHRPVQKAGIQIVQLEDIYNNINNNININKDFKIEDKQEKLTIKDLEETARKVLYNYN